MSSHLYHTEKGAEVKGHKWLTREGTPGNYIYTYYEKTAKKAKSALSSVSKSASKTASNVRKTAKKTASSVEKSVSKTSAKLSSTIKSATKYAEEKASKSQKKSSESVSEETKTAAKNLVSGKSSVGASDSTVSNDSGSFVSDVASFFKKVAAVTVSAAQKVAYEVEDYFGVNSPKSKPVSVADSGEELEKGKEPGHDSESMDATMSDVNPNYDSSWSVDFNSYNDGFGENCYSCSLAFDMKERGYDVQAIWDDDGESTDNILACYEGAEEEFENESGGASLIAYNYLQEHPDQKLETVEDLYDITEKSMLEKGEGAYGHLMLEWYGGGGHDVIWSVEKGQVVVRDCQSNKKVPLSTYLSYCQNWGYVQTNNKEVTSDIYKYVTKSQVVEDDK